ncbi:helix-turn-helix domain-containing protein [Actinoplanes teichomyceticus]|uniref:Helix-turn-helix protein n=1 Tax=Actinoplanes teichomyceticus TaxID=1867 RepID=A0A561VM99_ACTTI|nr:helix-turn-helix domain-containing protein [Actinoplanes teichomyceticus]TWG12749.1 helix-turn-helix protein [Actinoplanes teichomyceticus]GIF13483.1 hypothetical protein Ate01nite_35150 [Actinoplanes teichomyceticus]
MRREELAQLTGLSVDYILRLEQGRAVNPSAQVAAHWPAPCSATARRTRHCTTPTSPAAAAIVADLKDAVTRYPGDAGLNTLVIALRNTSELFAALWTSVSAAAPRQRTRDHPAPRWSAN